MKHTHYRWLGGAALLLAGMGVHAATPLEECAPSTVPITCLDAKLKQANLQLNAALKAATARIEALQKEGGRSSMGAFINSQRQFNSYRDTNCSWLAAGATPGQRDALIRDCQIRATLAREQELLAFAAGDAPRAMPAAPAPAPEPAPIAVAGEAVDEEAPPASVAVAPRDETPDAVARVTPPAAAQPAGDSVAASRGGVEWALQSWAVDGVAQRLESGSNISITFDAGGKVAGNASVNTFSGSYRFDADGRLIWPGGGFAVTRKSGPPELMRQERAFLRTLRNMRDFSAEGERLVLESASGRTVLTFAREP